MTAWFLSRDTDNIGAIRGVWLWFAFCRNPTSDNSEVIQYAEGLIEVFTKTSNPVLESPAACTDVLSHFAVDDAAVFWTVYVACALELAH